ncbi:MAG: 16S rRNA (guanine(527)-N(7))-methyltransferase RsmG [Candidatus Binataceae bacterium]
MKRRTGADSAPDNSARVIEIVAQSPLVASCNLAPQFFNRIKSFAAILATWGARTNLTAHPNDPAEVAFHIIDSLAPLFVVPSPTWLREGAGMRVLDLGSGAGFPGLILAAAIEAQFTLAEARRKRASFLSVAASEMGLSNVTVRVARASAETVETEFDIVTSRAVGEAGFEIAARALKAGGTAILWANAEQTINLDRAQRARLVESARHEYAVNRIGATARRVLITFHKR